METFEIPFVTGSLTFGHYRTGIPNPKSVQELDIIELSSRIREKSNWSDKINDPIIVEKWRYELADCYNGSIEVAAVDGTWQSDALIDRTLHDEFVSRVSVLENVSDNMKDWHPCSNNQVLHLVHPSLFSFVAGRTKVISKPQLRNSRHALLQFASDKELLLPDEATKFALQPTQNQPNYRKSKTFQWLPSEFLVDESGAVQISYINNLHPEYHEELYECIEKIFAKFVPMFNKVLTDLTKPAKNRIKVSYYNNFNSDTDTVSMLTDDDYMGEFGCYLGRNESPRMSYPIIIPEFEPPPFPKKVVNLNGRNLQVIVELANIHLTPDEPEFLETSGGSWHIEGTANERIVASGIYYYSSSNITKSRLNFRQPFHGLDWEQHDFADDSYKLLHSQYLGSIITKEGRCIAFPNSLEHQIAPFKLEDSTRNGHRKILAFFLVDPTVKILSTSQVPPQQQSWFKDEIHKESSSLPVEIVHKIIDLMDWPMTLEEAKKHRDDLMNERRLFVDTSNEIYFDRPVYLCEH
ncbi:hypothetical protein Bhyg_15853 [Pseudolycoriella hygida]|uniref:Uncharacterized protein n=1 Tax=Pseudolycoriella hygida TaxID=35572 RepID=A0A9Q0MLV7_9DIPT|nr:hypothetical protein Bhyg_15853 [Pseudolycoriella hygida]